MCLTVREKGWDWQHNTSVSLQSESQDQVFLRWTTGEMATMHILVVHAMVILLTLGPPKGRPAHVAMQCQMKSKAPCKTVVFCRWKWFLSSFGHLVSGQETSAHCLPGGHLRGGPSAPWLVETEDDPVRGFSAGWCRYHLPESIEFSCGILCGITFLREHTSLSSTSRSGASAAAAVCTVFWHSGFQHE